jgi:hypothetical protein
MAQALTNNNAIITVNPDTRMTIDGGVLNNGDLVNHGTISVTGDWMNVDTYTPSTGRLIFNGAQEQHIAHNHGQVFKLDMEGGGNKTITSAIEIQDTLNFIDGVVSVESGVSLLVQSNGVVVGGSDLSYVDGTLSHQGTGYKYFPVGTNNHFRPAELVNVSGNNPVVGISVHEPNADPIIPLQLLTISDTRFWQLTHQSGVYDGSQIRLKVEADENLSSDIDLQDVVVAKADSVGGVFLTLGQSLYSGSLQDGEVTSMLPATEGFLAIAVEGFAEERALFVPNALSPAAPNPEDQVIKVYGQQIVDEGFMFRIYNRWGHLVYETDSFVEANTVGWRGGSTNGELESVGVYQYTLTGRFASGKPFKRQGNIKVIR